MTEVSFSKIETAPVFSQSLRELAVSAAAMGPDRAEGEGPVLLATSFGPGGLPDGRGQADTLDQRQWEGIYCRLRAGEAGDAGLPGLGEIHGRAAAGEAGVTPIALFDVEYRRPGRALTQAILRARRDDAPIAAPEGALETQFDSRTAFAACALLAPAYLGFERQPDVHRGSTVRLRLASELWISNRPRPERVEVDFGDGSGFRDIAWDEVWDVTFDSDGDCRVVLRAHHADGPRTAAFQIAVDPAGCDPGLTSEGVSPAGGRHWHHDIEADIAYGGERYKGTCHIYNSGGSGPLKRPFLLAEGFPGGRKQDDIYDILNGRTPDGWGHKAQLADELRQQGYDVVVLTFSEGAPIQGNAFVYLKALQWMWENMGRKGIIVAAGGSMGGLIARYALTYAEFGAHKVDLHYVKALFTFDSPHLGANVPLAVQYSARFFGEKWAGDNNRLLNHICAKQMLMHQVWQREGTEETVKPEFRAFYAELEGLGNGGYPTRPVKYAASNGARTGGLIAQPEHMALHMWRTHGPGQQYRVLLHCSANRALTHRYQYAQCYFSEFGETITAYLEGGTFHSRDGCSGGITGHFQAVHDALDYCRLAFPGVDMPYPRNCFVPAYSALGVKVEGDAYGFKVSDLKPGQTPFNDWFAPEVNQWHCTVDQSMKAWVLSKLPLLSASDETREAAEAMA